MANPPHCVRVLALCLNACLCLAWADRQAQAQTLPPDAPEFSLPDVTGPAFSIAPLRVDMALDDTHSQVRLVNRFETEAAVQLRVFRWRQVNGRDIYEPASDLRLSPSITQMAPQAEQVFHVVREVALPPGEEHTYRIVIDQLPNPDRQQAGGTASRLQITLPLFVGSETAPEAAIAGRIEGQELILTNRGGATARISSLEFTGQDGSVHAINLSPGRYIHGGSSKRYALPAEPACANGRYTTIHGVIDRTQFDVTPASPCG